MEFQFKVCKAQSSLNLKVKKGVSVFLQFQTFHLLPFT